MQGHLLLLLTLCDIHDQSTAEFMTRFYRHFEDGAGKASALRDAMIELRERYPHPFHWAPFALVGKIFPSSTPATFFDPPPIFFDQVRTLMG